MKHSTVASSSSSSLCLVLVATLLLLLLQTSSVVDAIIGVPEISRELRCPACVSFAVALRRASWEGHPPFDVTDKQIRRKLLNHDNRCMELLTEAMDVLLMKQAFVYYVPPLPENLENIVLYFNKTDAPRGAVGRFWSLQDLYMHHRLQVSDFRAIRAIQDKNADQSLMHFLHNEIREELGDEAEALCYKDLNPPDSKLLFRPKEEYEIHPIGTGGVQRLNNAGKPFEEQSSEWLTLNILKDAKTDEDLAVDFAYELCKTKTMCAGQAAKAPGFGSGKNAVKKYIRSMMPIHPLYVEPRKYDETADEEKPLVEEDF